MIIVVMGVAGTGKSTIGQLLSEKTQIPFYDADDFHPASNVQKMASGQPLDDDDRQPWLEALADNIQKWKKDKGAILACSALKEKYRTILSNNKQEAIRWVHLTGTSELIASRMEKRSDHFMPSALLKSQFDTLETPANAITIDIGNKPSAMVDEIIEKLENG